MKEDLKTFCSFSSIVKKVEQDGYFQHINKTMDIIFHQEAKFAVSSHLRRTQSITKEKSEFTNCPFTKIKFDYFQRKFKDNFYICKFGHKLINSF